MVDSAIVVDDTLVGWLIEPSEVSESVPLPSSLQANGRSAQPNINLMATLRIEVPPKHGDAL